MGQTPSLPNISLNLKLNCCNSGIDKIDGETVGKTMVQPTESSGLRRCFKTRKSRKTTAKGDSQMAKFTDGLQSKQTDEKTVPD